MMPVCGVGSHTLTNGVTARQSNEKFLKRMALHLVNPTSETQTGVLFTWLARLAGA